MSTSDHHFSFVDRWKLCVRLWKWNEGQTNVRFFAAFLSLLVRCLRSSTLTESLTLYCEAFQDQAPLWENRTIYDAKARRNFNFFWFILSYFLNFFFYLRKCLLFSSKIKSCLNTFMYLLGSLMVGTKLSFIIDKNML